MPGAELARVTRRGGVLAFNVRTDQLAPWEAALDELTRRGTWRELQRLGPLSYLPADPRYATSVLAIAFAFRVL